MNKDPLRIAIADDHLLFVRSLSLMIKNIPEFEVVIEASNGKDLITRLAEKKGAAGTLAIM